MNCVVICYIIMTSLPHKLPIHCMLMCAFLQKVDGERLLVLNGDNLRDLGVENQFRQQTVLHYINHLKAGTAPRQPRSLTEFNVRRSNELCPQVVLHIPCD